MKFFISLIILMSFLFPVAIMAQTPPDLADQIRNQINAGAGSAGITDEAVAPQSIVAGIIKVILGLVGIIFTGLIVLGGYKYFTSAGEEEKAKQGATMVQQAVIGLVVILMAYAITSFVANRATESVNSQPVLNEGGAGGTRLKVQSSDIRCLFSKKYCN